MKNTLILLFLLVSLSAFSQFGRYPISHGYVIESGFNWSECDHYYDYNETSGDLLDKAGSNDGVRTGTTQGSSGILGTSYTFNGSTDIVTLSSGISLTNQDISVSFWLYPTSLSSDGNWLGGATGGMFVGFYAVTNGIRLGRVTDVLTSNTTITLTINQWNHVVAVYNQSANTVTFYIDGTSEVETFSAEFTGVTSIIGARTTAAAGPFTGRIDETGIFIGYKLTAQEVSDLYGNGTPPSYQ